MNLIYRRRVNYLCVIPASGTGIGVCFRNKRRVAISQRATAVVDSKGIQGEAVVESNQHDSIRNTHGVVGGCYDWHLGGGSNQPKAVLPP